MKTKRIQLDELLRDKASLAVVARRVSEGALLVYPTETIYGIGGVATKESVREKIYEAKTRPEKNPLILIASRPEAFDYLNLDFPASALALADAFWPGDVTLVLNKKRSDETMAVRVSSHPFITTLLSLVNAPLFSTSANVSAQPYNPDPKAIEAAFDGKVEFIINAGWLVPKPPSTVVRITPDNVTIMLREGAASTEDIKAVVGKIY